jgi:hypothetical protein
MAKKATCLFPGELDSGDPAKNPPDYPWRILAEGDSWFSFGSWRLENMLQQITFRKDTIIVSLAEPGDTMIRMSDIFRNPALDMQLDSRWGYAWDAILLSGGGNDVIARAGAIIPPSKRSQKAARSPESYCDLDKLNGTLRSVAGGFRKVVELRDRPQSPCRGKPILAHTYDLCTPRESPARFLAIRLGPWLFPALRGAKVPQSEWNPVSDFILRALGDKLTRLTETLPNFHIAPTQGTLRRATLGSTGTSNDWENEIHPTRTGYAKVAKTIGRVLDPLLP